MHQPCLVTLTSDEKKNKRQNKQKKKQERKQQHPINMSEGAGMCLPLCHKFKQNHLPSSHSLTQASVRVAGLTQVSLLNCEQATSKIYSQDVCHLALISSSSSFKYSNQ